MHRVGEGGARVTCPLGTCAASVVRFICVVVRVRVGQSTFKLRSFRLVQFERLSTVNMNAKYLLLIGLLVCLLVIQIQAGIICDESECNKKCITELKPGGECKFLFICSCREINIG
ncbi:hypothetical protein M3Y97_00189800 [Aphelenchoides bicaudatus]|nr:hypothetical protein M3Y97_00189800 [Aphelenchoides bicaudatus]